MNPNGRLCILRSLLHPPQPHLQVCGGTLSVCRVHTCECETERSLNGRGVLATPTCHTHLVPGVGPPGWVSQNDNELGLREEGVSSVWSQRVCEVSGTLLIEDGREIGHG